jgi:nicotinate phosphoribosyltransferase
VRRSRASRGGVGSEPTAPPVWLGSSHAALLTDLYQLTMVQAYWREGMAEDAVFSLYFRELPPERNFILACGLDDALTYLEGLRFDDAALEQLRRLDAPFSSEFLDWLAGLRFRGDVHAVAEGTPVFPYVPLLEVVAPIAEAQLAESLLMNQIHVQSVLASKAARLVAAAEGRPVVDFGMRRMHGTDAALKGARAYYVAGLAATSNVLAGCIYEIPASGTMAHSYVEAHDDEVEAFRAFARLYPGTTLLVDTYDTLEGVRRVVRLVAEEGLEVGAVRLDSGDLAELARGSRKILDEAGLEQVKIFASGSLDEEKIAAMVASGAPIDAFGVGTRMGVSRDAPSIDLAYKLTAYAGQGRLKTSPGKPILPGRKQVFRQEGDDGRAVRDVVARWDEQHPGRPLLEPVMQRGRRLAAGRVPLAEVRERARRELAALPDRIRGLEAADPPYEVRISDALERLQREVEERVSGRG